MASINCLQQKKLIQVNDDCFLIFEWTIPLSYKIHTQLKCYKMASCCIALQSQKAGAFK